MFGSEQKRLALMELNALVREYPEKFDDQKKMVVNNLQKRFVQEMIVEKEAPELSISNMTREEGAAVTPLLNQLQQTLPGSPERLEVLQNIKNFKDIANKAKLGEQVKLDFPSTEIPAPGKVLLGTAEGLAKGATAGHISLIDEQSKRLEEVSKDLRIPKDIRESTKSMLDVAETSKQKLKTDPLYKTSEVMGHFVGFAAPIVGFNKAVSFVKLAKYAPKLSQSGKAMLQLGENVLKGGTVGAGFGGIKKLEQGETRTESIISNAALFALFDGLIGLKDVNKLLKKKSIEEIIASTKGKDKKKLLETYEYYGDLAEQYADVPKGTLFDSDDIRLLRQFQKEQANLERLKQSPKGAKLLNESLTHDERASLKIGKIPILKAGKSIDKYKIEPRGMEQKPIVGVKTSAEEVIEMKRGAEARKQTPRRGKFESKDAVYAYIQEDFRTGGKIPFFNVTKRGHPLEGSSVTEETLIREGLEVPQHPLLREVKSAKEIGTLREESKTQVKGEDKPVGDMQGKPKKIKTKEKKLNFEKYQKETGIKIEKPPEYVYELSLKDFSKGVTKAVKKSAFSKKSGIVADPFKEVRDYLEKHNLSAEAKKQLTETVSTIWKSKLLSESEKLKKIESYLSNSKPVQEMVAKTPVANIVKKISGKKFLSIREEIQDHQIKIRKLQEFKGVKTTERTNRYDAEVRFHGRVGSRVEKMNDVLSKIDKNIIDTSKKINIKDQDLASDVYSYLIAKHTPERNLALNQTKSTGITNKQAEDILNAIKNKPHFNEIKKIANDLTDLNKKTLDTLLDGEVISSELHHKLRTRYKYHVPLQRILEDSDDVIEVLSGGTGFNVRTSGLKGAKGSELEVADLLDNIATNVGRAIELAEKNRVNLTTLKFAKENPELGLFEIIKPKVIGKGKNGQPIFERIDTGKRTPYLAVREKGKQVIVKIKDPVFAEAYKGTGIHENNSPMFSVINSFSRFISSISTRYNPEFALPNMIRDSQEMAAYLASQKSVGVRGALKAIGKQFGSAMDVMSSIWGKSKRPGAKIYEEMKAEGGTTGGMALSTRKQLELDINKIKKINRNKPRQAAQKVVGFVDNLNSVFEDATRLSVYKEVRSRGFSKSKSAVMAKEASINFNRKGKSTPLINALWIFANASAQGSVKMLKAMKKPKVMAGILTGTGVSTWTVNYWNDLVDGEWRDKTSDWDRRNNLVMLLPTEDGIKNIKIPVSWGLKPFKAMWDNLYDTYNGIEKRNVGEITTDFVGTVLDAYNPVGGSNLRQAITPTILDVPVDLWSNQAWHGGEIAPEYPYFKQLPEHLKYFEKLNQKEVGKYAIDATKKLYSTTGIDISPADMTYVLEQYGGGVFRAGSRTVNTISGIGKDDFDSRELFVINRFYKHTPQKQLDKIKQYKELGNNYYQNIKTQSSMEQFERWKTANEYLKEYKEAETKEAKLSILKRAYFSDPRIFEKMKRDIRADKLNMTPKEKFINGLDNEIRAKVIIEELNKLKTKKEKVKLYVAWKKMGIISKQTTKEMVKNGYRFK